MRNLQSGNFSNNFFLGIIEIPTYAYRCNNFFGKKAVTTAQCSKTEKYLQKINIRLCTVLTKPCKGLSGT